MSFLAVPNAEADRPSTRYLATATAVRFDVGHRLAGSNRASNWRGRHLAGAFGMRRRRGKSGQTSARDVWRRIASLSTQYGAERATNLMRESDPARIIGNCRISAVNRMAHTVG